MDCREVEIQLIAFYEGQLDRPDAERIRGHLEECHRCREELASIERVLSALQSQRLPDPGEVFWKEFPWNVRNALSHEGLMHSENPALPRVWERMYGAIKGIPISKPIYAAVPIAAVIVLVLGLFLFKGGPFWTGPRGTGEEFLEGSFSIAGVADSSFSPVLNESLSLGELHYISQELVGWLHDMGNLGEEGLAGEGILPGEDVFATLDGLSPKELDLVYDVLQSQYLKPSNSSSIPMGIGGGRFS